MTTHTHPAHTPVHGIDASHPAWRPTPEQALLLAAALAEERDEAKCAWDEWRSRVDIEAVDPGSHQLLPLLYRNLYALGLRDPALAKLRGLHRHSWYRNQMVFRRMVSLLAALHDAGIATMVLKGAALTILYYGDYGLRPMLDFDILVPTEQAEAAIGLLAERGWQPVDQPVRTLTPAFRATRHAIGFYNAEGDQFDLHWHLMAMVLAPDADCDFWQAAVPIDVAGTRSLALCPADQLLHICAHATLWTPTPQVRWVADAVTLVRQSPTLDWDRVARQAIRCRLVMPLRATLTYLSETWALPIPASVLAQLARAPVSVVDRKAFRAAVTAQHRRGPALTFWLRYAQYRWTEASRKRSPGAVGHLTGFVRFLQHRWAAAHLWQVPYFAWSKTRRRAGEG